MKILMATEFFHPFSRGGSEWSTFYLAKALAKKGHDVFIATPNYGTSTKETWKNLKIFRIPFPVKLTRNSSKSVSPYFFTNPLWWVVSFFALLRLSRSTKSEIIHLQGKYFLPAGIAINFLTKKPVILTIRDYQIVCPHGLCLTKKRHYKCCSLNEFVSQEIFEYIELYNIPKRLSIIILQFLSSIRGRFVSYLLFFLANRVQGRVCISRQQKAILDHNGLRDSVVIYNLLPADIKKSNPGTKNSIVFAGRLTPGKGIWNLIKAFEKISRKNKTMKLEVVGDGFLKAKISSYLREKSLNDRIHLRGQLSYRHALKIMQSAKMVVVPSTWEEPFGRVALEAVVLGVPVVSTNRGGLPEIVENKVTGIIVDTSVAALIHGIDYVWQNNSLLRQKITKHKKEVWQKFYQTPLDQYIKLYKKFV